MIGQECIDPFGNLIKLIIQVKLIRFNYMQKRGSVNKSPIILNATENKFDMGDLFTNGENHRGKIPLGEFKVTTSELQQAITSKRILVPYTNL